MYGSGHFVSYLFFSLWGCAFYKWGFVNWYNWGFYNWYSINGVSRTGVLLILITGITRAITAGLSGGSTWIIRMIFRWASLSTAASERMGYVYSTPKKENMNV